MTGAGADRDPVPVTDGLRQILAQVTGNADLLAIGPDTPLLGARAGGTGDGGAGLDSLAGTLLLAEVERRFGVDVAAEDLNLDSLATLGTLAGFITARLAPPGPGRPGDAR